MSSSYVLYSSADNGRKVLDAATDEASLFRAAISLSSVTDDVTGQCPVFSGITSTEEPVLLSRTGNSEKPTKNND